MNLKELLGDAYKEDLTLTEIDNLLASKKLVDISTGNYVSKEKAEREKQEALDKLTADYESKSATSQKATDELNEKIKALESEKQNSLFVAKIKEHNIDEKYLDYVKGKYEYNDDIDKNLEEFAKQNPAFLNTTKKVDFPPLENTGGNGAKNVTTLAEALQEKYE